jgi:uncharacterized protein RhaS with RHS repeats
MRAGRSLHVLIAAAVFALAGAPAIGQNSANYQYDKAGRLKTVTYLDGSQTTYGLDAAGNRLNVGTGKNTTPPGAPASVTGTAPASTQVNLTWAASSTVPSGATAFIATAPRSEPARLSVTRIQDSTAQPPTATPWLRTTRLRPPTPAGNHQP